MSINQELQAMLAEVRQATAEVQAATREQKEARAADQEAHAATDKEQAAKRRNGDEGRDWQVLQQRIDMNKTTMSDILTGVDVTEEARRVRAHIQRDVLPRMRAQFAEAMATEDVAATVSGLREAQEGLAAALNSVQGPRQGR